MRTVFYLIQKEALQVLRDRVMMAQIFLIPLVQLLIITSAATFEVREAKVHLIDADHTPASRRVADAFRASEHFAISERSASADAGSQSLQTRRADLVLHLPAQFERDLQTDQRPDIRLLVNGEKASAGIVQSYAQQILQGVATDYGTELQMAEPISPGTERAQMEVQSRLRYNAALEYDDYMAAGILTLLVTIVGTLLTAQNIVREQEIGTIEQLNVTPITKGQFIAGKLSPFWVLGLLEFGLGLIVAWLAYDLPIRGSLLLLFGVAGVYLIVALGIGLWISTVVDTQQQAMLVTFFVLVLYLLMSGLFTPVSSMPTWAEWVAELSPLKHFIEIMRQVLMKGAGPLDIWQPTILLAGYGGVILSVAVRQYSKTST